MKTENGTKTAKLTPIKLTVKVATNTPAIITTAKGSIDLAAKENGIVYTITGVKNVNYTPDMVESIRLIGADSDRFTVEQLEPDAKGQLQVMVKARNDKDFNLKDYCQYAFSIKLAGITDPVSSRTYKIKPKQTTLKFAVTGDMNVYQSGSAGEIDIAVTGPAGAAIAVIEDAAKGTTVPQGALSWQLTTNPDGSAKLSYTVENSALLKPKASYKIALSVTPDGNATGKAPQALTVTLKVVR